MKQLFLSVFLAVLASLATLPGAARAQDAAWIQIEAHPDLRTARERARIFALTLDQVHAFRMDTGWYAIAVGPLSRGAALAEARRLRLSGLVPGDSYVVDGDSYARQFWPIDSNAGTTAADQAERVTGTAPAPSLAEPARETPAEARARERALTGAERRDLQRALQWFGFYDAGIDGAFGRGTRAAMSDWQAARGYEPTGVLTTRQRARLMDEYRTIQDRLGMRLVTDETAGIRLLVPTALVAFDRYEPPFAHYEAETQDGVRLLLISQAGGRATLHGLFDVMQTLEIVPLDGTRRKDADSFLLTGRDDEIVSYTHARLEDGFVKGFTLIWPPEMDATMSKITRAMQASLASVGDTALDESAAPPLPESQRRDLLSGLEIRKPAMSRSGFYVDDRGTVLTAAEVVADCTRITIEGDYEARVALTDAALGLAVLRPTAALAPIGYAAFRETAPRLRSEIAVAGYSFGGALGAPTLSYGELAELSGLQGEAELNRLSLRAEEGDTGGPVFAPDGRVLGMLVAAGPDGKRLPEDVRFAAEAGALVARLREAGVDIRAGGDATRVAAEDLTGLARDITVLVSCWK